MKIKAHTPLLALLFVSGFLHAQTTIPAVDTPVTVEGNVVVEGTALVNDTLTVQPALVTTTTTNINAAPGTPTTLEEIIPGNGGPVKLIVTSVQNVDVDRDTTTGGGVVAETNGDLTLNSTAGLEADIPYSVVVTQEVAQPTNANPVGVAIPGTEKYYLATKVPVEGSPGVFTFTIIDTPAVAALNGGSTFFANPAAVDAFVAGLTVPQLQGIDPLLATEAMVEGTGGNLTVNGNTILGDSATDTTTINGETTINGPTTINGESTTNGNSAITGNLDVDGATTTDGITNDGNIATTTLGVSSNATVGGNLGVTGATTTGSLGVTNNATVGGSLAVSGATTTAGITNTGGLTNSGGLTNTGGLTSTGATQLNGTLNAGATTTASLTNTGNATIGGTLGVTGTTTTNGIVNNGNISTTTLGVASNATIGGTLGVTGNTTLGGTLAVAGVTSTNGIVNTGNISTTGSLAVSGATTTNGLTNTGTLRNVGLVDTNTLLVRGLSTMNGIDNGGQRITGLGDGVFANDAATFGQLTEETNARIAGDKSLRGSIDKNTRGIAMVAAMTNTRVEAGKTHGVDFNMAQYGSETGFAFGYANRINDCVQVHGSLASTTDFDESVVRVGVAIQW